MGRVRTARRDGDFRHDGGVPAIGIANPTPDGGYEPPDTSLYPGVYGYGTLGGTDLFAFGTAGKISTTDWKLGHPYLPCAFFLPRQRTGSIGRLFARFPSG